MIPKICVQGLASFRTINQTMLLEFNFLVLKIRIIFSPRETVKCCVAVLFKDNHESRRSPFWYTLIPFLNYFVS